LPYVSFSSMLEKIQKTARTGFGYEEIM